MQTVDHPRPPLRRAVRGRELAGVCAGLAEHLGLHPNALRVGFALLAFAGGLGFLVYGVLWATVAEDPGERPDRGTGEETAQGGPTGWLGDRLRVPDSALWVLFIGVALIVTGAVFGLQGLGVNLRLDLTIPFLVVALGAVFAWSQLDEATRRRWVPGEGPQRNQAVIRLAIGLAIAVVGLIMVVSRDQGLGELWDMAVAVLVVLVGVTLIVAPYAMRLWRDLRREQTARIRATERADIAAHLHDSVLQTLALIQRRADDPAQVNRLARAQERELRNWLYAGPSGADSSLASAITAVGHEVEDLHGVPIEVVVTGDRDLDQTGSALVSALREAMTNAVRHGAPPVSAYVEVGPSGVEAFVRDHGPGFDPEAVSPDRLGVRESILGRMQRHGGSARIRRLDHGTEVSLTLPGASPHTQSDEGAP